VSLELLHLGKSSDTEDKVVVHEMLVSAYEHFHFFVLKTKKKKYIELVEVFEGIIPIYICVHKQTCAKFINIINICSADFSILYENGGL
jgi:hypothetical protein